ncbi:MAG: alpha/beta fold hydrolase [Alphaproteobacteria bacterium]|nr:alpha/beta fold hydrolase [Alphaproteobacteria bacterium]
MPVEKSISIGEGDDALFGTLTLPDDGDRFDAVLIWSGSGPTDRDGNLPGHINNCLEMMAHQLADAGYASIRTDKRGIGESEKAVSDEADLRFETYVDDALVWVQVLKEVPGVRHVFLLGHSEGALITTLVAQDFGAAGLILVAGTGFPAADILRRQLSAPDINIPKHHLTEIGEILDSLEAGNPVAKFSPELEGQYRQSVQPYLMSWFKYDPQAELAKTKMPVLVMQGTTDFQVSMEDGERLADARDDIDYLEIKGMNHVLKDAPKHKASNYATYGKPLLKLAIPLMPAITDFLDKQAPAASAANDR